MASERACPRAPRFIDPPGYARHRPEATLLYELVERHYPEFVAARADTVDALKRYCDVRARRTRRRDQQAALTQCRAFLA